MTDHYEPNPNQERPYVDWRGSEIHPGDHVVYAVTQSSRITMIEAKVIEIGTTDTVTIFGRTPALKVERLREATPGFAGTISPGSRRTAVLTRPDRVIKVFRTP